MKKIYSFGYYEEYIQSNFIIDDISIDTSKIGEKDFETKIKLEDKFLDSKILKNELQEIISFIKCKETSRYDEILWVKINVTDQAVNDYQGIGIINKHLNFIPFITEYLNFDRAAQSGDTIFVIFDLDFNWSVNFILSQDNGYIEVIRFNGEKHKTQFHNK